MIIDLMIAAPRLASRIGIWCVLEVITLSDHRCIEFSIQERSHPVNVGRGSKVRIPSWNTKRLTKDELREHLEKTRLMDELDWVRSAGSLEDTVRAARRKVVAACDHMPVPFFIWGLARGHLSIRGRRATLPPLGSFFQKGRGRRSFFRPSPAFLGYLPETPNVVSERSPISSYPVG